MTNRTTCRWHARLRGAFGGNEACPDSVVNNKEINEITAMVIEPLVNRRRCSPTVLEKATVVPCPIPEPMRQFPDVSLCKKKVLSNVSKTHALL